LAGNTGKQSLKEYFFTNAFDGEENDVLWKILILTALEEPAD
jgi:hypothetical protein